MGKRYRLTASGAQHVPEVDRNIVAMGAIKELLRQDGARVGRLE